MGQSAGTCTRRTSGLRIFLSLAPNIIDQHHTEIGWTEGLATANMPYCRHDFQCRGVFQYIASYPQTYGLHEDIGIVFHANKDDIEMRVRAVQVAQLQKVDGTRRKIRKHHA